MSASYTEFVSYMQQRANSRTKRDCPHVADRLVANGVTLTCCDGAHGGRCKSHEIQFLLQYIQNLHQRLDDLKAQGPQIVNNNTINIHQEFYIGDVLKPQCGILANVALAGGNVYHEAFKLLQTLPPSEQRDQMLKLATSTDLADGLDYQREILGMITWNPPVSGQAAEILKAKIDFEQKRIDRIVEERGLTIAPSSIEVIN
jgi:hypothetical protein